MQKCGAYRPCVHGSSWTPLFGGSGRVTCMVTLADAECQDLLTLSARMQKCGAYRRCVHGSSWTPLFGGSGRVTCMVTLAVWKP